MSIQSEIDRLTTIKANLKAAINGASGAIVGDVFGDYPGAITSGKAAIASAITEKGVATAADATFQQMANNIVAIETGGGEAAIKEIPPEQFLTSETAFVIIEYNGYSYLASHKTLGTDIRYASGGVIFIVNVEVDAFSVSLISIESVGEVYTGYFSNGNYSETAYYGSSAHFYDFI